MIQPSSISSHGMKPNHICPYCHSGRDEWDFFTTLQRKNSSAYEKSVKPFSNPYFKEFSLENLPVTSLDQDIRRLIYNHHRAPNTSVYKGNLNEKWFELNIPDWTKMDKFNQEKYLAEKIDKNEFLKELKNLRPTDVPIKLAFPRFDPRQQFQTQSLNILGLIDLARLAIWIGSKEYFTENGKPLEKAVEELKNEHTIHGNDFFRTFKKGKSNYVCLIPYWYAVLFDFLLKYRENADGLPDFIIYNVANDFFYFVECKANSGQLSQKQIEVKNWIQRYNFPYLVQHREIEISLNLGESKYLNNEGIYNQSIQNLINKIEKERASLKRPEAIERRNELLRELKKHKTN